MASSDISQSQKTKIKEACDILKKMGFPKTQYNERSGRVLVAILDVKPETPWSEAVKRAISTDEIRSYIHEFYGFEYKWGSRETIRKQTLHQFVDASLIILNEDDPTRSTNSGDTNYRISDEALVVIQKYGTLDFQNELETFIKNHGTLIEKYDSLLKESKLPLQTSNLNLLFSPGAHNKLQIEIITKMQPYFLKDAVMLYVGDTANKTLYSNKEILNKLGVAINKHDKLPDIIYYDEEKNIMFLIEAVATNGPVSRKRYNELESRLNNCSAKRMYITAFPSVTEFKKYAHEIAWESEVWLANNPTHMIHFNGPKFLYVIDDENQKCS